MVPPKILRMAAIQMCSNNNREENLDLAHTLLLEAVEAGARLIALPENFSFLGRDGKKTSVVEDFTTGPSIELLRSFSARHKVVLVGGTIPMAADHPSKVTNTCLVFDTTGTFVARYDKLHLFDIRLDTAHTFEESRFIEPGSQVVTATLFGHVMGLSICYDLRFPELYRSLVRDGAKVLFVPAAFTAHTGKAHWEVLLRSRAIENQCFVVASAQYGHHGPRRESFGHTMIIDPWGRVMDCAPDGTGVVVCDIDFGYIDRVRQRLPCLEHIRFRRPMLEEQPF